MELVERAIYRLPNGRELAVSVTESNSILLFNLSSSDRGQYEVNSEGRLLFNGNLTAWELKDLSPTGRFVSPEVHAALFEDANRGQDSVNERSL